MATYHCYPFLSGTLIIWIKSCPSVHSLYVDLMNWVSSCGTTPAASTKPDICTSGPDEDFYNKFGTVTVVQISQ